MKTTWYWCSHRQRPTEEVRTRAPYKRKYEYVIKTASKINEEGTDC